MFKVNNGNTRKMCRTSLKLKIKTPQRRRSSVFIVNFEQISQIALVFPLLTLIKCIKSGKSEPVNPNYFSRNFYKTNPVQILIDFYSFKMVSFYMQSQFTSKTVCNYRGFPFNISLELHRQRNIDHRPQSRQNVCSAWLILDTDLIF